MNEEVKRILHRMVHPTAEEWAAHTRHLRDPKWIVTSRTAAFLGLQDGDVYRGHRVIIAHLEPKEDSDV